ncbi:MAG: hypothetical protein QOE17_1417, partial [Gaiellales bacterium]|nr:hypothetical protein [Gaiellales bacterium]
QTQTFTNSTTMALFDAGDAAPYPTTLDVSGMQGTLSGATVTLKSLTMNASDLDFMLVSPAGRTVVFLSDAAGGASMADLTFDDAAASQYPGGAFEGPATYQPTDNDGGTFLGDDFDNGAPAAPNGTTMSALNGDDPNGTWKLYVAANGQGGSPSEIGSLQGWSITLTTTSPDPPPPPPPPPTPDPTPPTEPTPPPAAPVDPTAPQVQSADFVNPPVAGQYDVLHVVARDPDSLVTGLLVDFGENLGLWAESACIAGQAPKGGTVSFDVPFRYLGAGEHTITITVLSGGCGEAQATQITKTVTVGGAAARRAHVSAVSLPIGPPPASKCKNALLSPTRAKTKLIVAAVLCLMNEQRAKFKLKPVKNSKRLSTAALTHTRAMILGQFFAHQGPKEPALVARLRKVKYSGAAGENIGAGAGPLGSPAAMVDGWMHSPLHRANLLSKRWKAVGIGFVAQYPVKTLAQPVATYTTDFAPKP